MSSRGIIWDVFPQILSSTVNSELKDTIVPLVQGGLAFSCSRHLWGHPDTEIQYIDGSGVVEKLEQMSCCGAVDKSNTFKFSHILEIQILLRCAVKVLTQGFHSDMIVSVHIYFSQYKALFQQWLTALCSHRPTVLSQSTAKHFTSCCCNARSVYLFLSLQKFSLTPVFIIKFLLLKRYPDSSTIDAPVCWIWLLQSISWFIWLSH